MGRPDIFHEAFWRIFWTGKKKFFHQFAVAIISSKSDRKCNAALLGGSSSPVAGSTGPLGSSSGPLRGFSGSLGSCSN